MTEIVVYESVVYRVERHGEICHFGFESTAKAYAGYSGTVTPIKIKKSVVKKLDAESDKEIEILRLKNILHKISTQTDQLIVMSLCEEGLCQTR